MSSRLPAADHREYQRRAVLTAVKSTIEMLERRTLLSAAVALYSDGCVEADAGHADHAQEGHDDTYGGPLVRPRRADAPRPDANGTPFTSANDAGNVSFDGPEVEPNNTPGAATPISIGATNNTISASIGSSGDFDFYSFTLAQRSGVFLDVDAAEIGLSLQDSQIRLYDSAGTVILAENDDGDDFETFALNDDTATSRSYDSALYADLAAGSYVVRVSSSQTYFPSGTGSYLFKVRSDTNYSSSVPAFQSLPGAADTLYLDFDGHSATDAWGTYTIQPFDISGNGAEFTPAERSTIENVWRTVAEDYAPFNINVATSYGGSYANGVGFRQVIGSSTGSEVGFGGALGVAYRPSYNAGGTSDNTAFTFAKNFESFYVGGDGGVSGWIGAAAIEMGNTTSHEFGHALGLLHYGAANPQTNGIMHTPDFGLNRERWKAGTTKSDESPVQAQVDVNVISSLAAVGGYPNNTFGYRSDDHGNSIGAATLLSPVGSSYTSAGIIGQKTDTDFFRFDGSSSTTLSVRMPENIANLDAELHLYNEAGTLIQSSDSSGTIFANITMNLPVGAYFAEVRSDGGEGEIGQYTLNVSTTTSEATGAISGKAFHDFDNDNVFDPGETVLSGVTIRLDRDNDGSIDATAVTDANGDYTFTGLTNATYQLTEVPPSGFAVKNTQQVIINAGQSFTGTNFANRPIGNVVFTGTAAADNYLLRRSADGLKFEVLIGGALTHVVPTANVTSLAFNLAGGNDALTVDYLNGVPFPTGGLRYDGGGLAPVDFDKLTINGSAGADAFKLINVGGVTPLEGNIGLHTASGGKTVDSVTVNGGAGNDTLTIDQVVFAPVTFNGGADFDRLHFNASQGTDADVLINTGSLSGGGNAASYTGLEFLNVYTLASGDTVTVNTGAGAPDTTLDLGDWHDTVNVVAAATVLTILGGDGNDTVTLAAGVSGGFRFEGGANSDSLVINASNGDDTISVEQTYVIGDSGLPTYLDLENLTVNANDGADAVNVHLGLGSPALTLNLGTGNDSVNIYSLNNTAVTVNGGSGSDQLANANPNVTGPITFNGGADSDSIRVSGNDASQTFDITASTLQRRGTSLAFSFTETESLFLDALLGNDIVNADVTGAGPAVVHLDGGDGNDTFNIIPSSTATFRIVGGNPTTAPGDTLNITQNGATQTGNVSTNADGFQEISYSNRQPVQFVQIETLGSGVDQPPVIGGLTSSPDPVAPEGTLTLTATGVADPNGGILTVNFYRESNGVAGLQVGSDAQVGTDSIDPYLISIAAPAESGTYTYYAQVTDASSRTSNVASTTSTVDPAPTIAGVFVSGSAWNSTFLNFLATSGQGEAPFGYRINASEQTDELPWVNLNRISIRFNENVNVAADDLVVRGVNVATYGFTVAAVPFTYDAATFTATWTLAAPIAHDKILLDLDGDPGSGVTDAAGNALDGEWINPVAPAISGDTFPSGEGNPGGDFHFRLNVLPGDVNRSGGSVVGSDVTLTRNAQNSPPGGENSLYTIFKDVNGSASILGSDVTLVRNRQGTRLPLDEPVAPAADVAADVSAEQTTAPQMTTQRTMTPTSTSTTPRPLFATGSASRSAMRLLAQQFDLLGDTVDQPLVA